MFDIYCPHCGEPWEHDTLHDVEGVSYSQASKAFIIQGCTLLRETGSDSRNNGSICEADPVVSGTDLAAINGAHEMSDYPEEWDYDLAFAIYNGGDV